MRVVLLNDNAAERNTMCATLQRASVRVEAFADAKGAMAAIAREPPQVVVVVAPAKGGADLIRLLRGADASGQVYFLAVLEGAHGGRDIPIAIEAGAHDFMRRPFVETELVERVKRPERMIKWARSVTTATVFDFTAAVDPSRLRVWPRIGVVIADDLRQMLGQPVEVLDGWPPRFGREVRGATIPMWLPADQIEIRVSIAVDVRTAAWLGGALLGNAKANDAAIDDVLRELANMAGGAVKRAVTTENINLAMGIPATSREIRSSGEGTRTFTLAAEGGSACIGVVGEVRQIENQRMPTSKLREGMILVHDLRSETGALLVAAGSRLTNTSAVRLAQALGERFLVEVTNAS